MLFWSNIYACVVYCTSSSHPQGSHASQDEAGTVAAKAVELDNRLEGRAVQVRVVQGKEPPHFIAVFGGKMVIFEGGYASAFDGKYQRRQVPFFVYYYHFCFTYELTFGSPISQLSPPLHTKHCLFLTQNLECKPRISFLAKSSFSKLGVLHRLLFFTPPRGYIRIYKGLVRPHIEHISNVGKGGFQTQSFGQNRVSGSSFYQLLSN